MANVVLGLSVTFPSWIAARGEALSGEAPTMADLDLAALTMEEVRQAFPKFTGRAGRPQVSPTSWQKAFSKASNSLFQISARMVADKEKKMEDRRKSVAVLSKLSREETLSHKKALPFFWSLFLYSDEPWLRLMAIENFSSLFQAALRPFLLGGRRLEFPSTQKTWEERFALRIVRDLKLVIADPKEDPRMKREALEVLRRFRRIIKPKGFWADRLAQRETKKFPGLNDHELSLALTGLSRTDLGGLKVDHRHRVLLPLSIGQFHAICRRRQIWLAHWERRGAKELGPEARLLMELDEAHRQKDHRKFFMLLEALLNLLV